jgi:membrane-bound lytic murein transglycosylase D
MIKRTYISLAILSAITSCSALANLCVIGSDQLPITSLSTEQIAGLYQGSAVDSLTPVDLPSTSTTYAEFYNEFLHWTPAEVNSFWSGQVFGGGAQQPQQANSDAEAISDVRNNPGVVAYLDLSSIPAGTKALYCVGGMPGAMEYHAHNAAVHHAKAVATKHAAQHKSSARLAAASIANTATDSGDAAIDQLVSGQGVDHMSALVAKKSVHVIGNQSMPVAAATTTQSAANSDSNSNSNSNNDDLSAIAADIDQLNISQKINNKETVAKNTTEATQAVYTGAATPATVKSNEGLIWPELISNYGLDDSISNPRVKQQIDWYIAHKSELMQAINNSKLYLQYVYSQTQQKNMPSELALLPIVESDYDPYAYSNAGATGLWQMMPGTAESYQLNVDWWYDGLSDVRTSTDAALNYLQHIDSSLHSWSLTLAAYNGGYGTVHLAREKAQSDDYWALSTLPAETKTYVPRLMAVAYIIAHADQYGIQLPNISAQPYFVPVKMTSQIELVKAANLAEISPKLLKALNPGFKRFATSPDSTYELLIPADKSATFIANLKQIAGSEQRTWIYHEARAGETLSSIARVYHTSEDLLRSVNGLITDSMSLDQGVLVPLSLHRHYTPATAPVTSGAVTMFADQMPVAKDLQVQVGSGDTVISLATKYSVTPAQIRLWNHLAPDADVKSGQTIHVWLIGADDATTYGHEAGDNNDSDHDLDKILQQIYATE